MDIEWAYALDAFHVLQARPITRYVPLPPELTTAAGERRRLYIDAALSKGLTTNAPVSVLGLDNLRRGFTTIIESWAGRSRPEPAPEDELFLFAGARMYMNLSPVLWIASPRMLARSNAPTDMLMARILQTVDRKRYRSARRPRWLGIRLIWLRESRISFTHLLTDHVRSFPAVIDSRGRILRPKPVDEMPGLLRGMAVSAGLARGPVKLLRRADEKHIAKGDVLIAYTTDPGWTPLFVNAAAIVLEVGGVLQHGAVVAREFAKPCVIGIDRVMDRLQDGDVVEVDGVAGTVRIVARREC